MANNLFNNKTALQTLLTSVQEKANAGGAVTSVNGKAGDVVIKPSDLNMVSKEWTFSSEEGATLSKNVLIYNKGNSIDFTQLRSLSISEGIVKRISHGETVLWKEPGLPKEYQQVTYVRKPLGANTYIDLGFAFDTSATIYIDYIKHSANYYYLFGAAENSGKLRCMISEGDNISAYGSNGSAYLGISIKSGSDFVEVERKLKYTLKKGGLKVEDLASSTSSSTSSTQAEYVMTNNLYLFGQNYNGSSRTNGDFSVSSFRYYDKNNKLKCDLIPCYKKSNGEVGMYDFIRGIFLTASNGGLIAGETIGGVEITYKNWARYSTESDDVTIYNSGQGYKDGYRVRSGGAEQAQNDGSCTGFIPVKAGDVIRLSGYDLTAVTAANAINIFDANHTNLGQVVANSATVGYGILQSTWKNYNWGNAGGVKESQSGVYTWVVPPDPSIAYIRVTGKTGGTGASMIVTVNEELDPASILPSDYQRVLYIYIPLDAHINTQWVPSEGSLFKIKFSIPGYSYIFGCGSSPRLAISFSDTGTTQVYNTSNGTGGMYSYSNLSYNDVYTLETYSTNTTGSYVNLDGVITQNNAAQNTAFVADYPMLLGSWQYDASTLRKGTINLYYARAIVNGSYAFEMIPCYRKSDGVIGMYDVVSKTFFTNAGGSSFEKGPNVG